ncbi:MAG: diguanylate cyclase [Gemmatimonadota bacterium]
MPQAESNASANDSRRYRILLESSRRLGARLSPDELHQAIFEETSNAVDAPGFYLALHDQGRDLARVVYFAEHGRGQHADIPYRGSDSEVLSRQRAYVVETDLSEGSVLTVGEGDSEPKSAMVAPLVHNGRVVGAISAQTYTENAYAPDDLEMLEGIADVAAVAIHNSQLFAELERRRTEAEQLEEIGRALASNLDPDQVVGLVITAASEVLDVDGVALWLREPHRPGVCRVAESGGEIALPVGLEWEITGDIAETVMVEKQPITLDNLAHASLPEHIAAYLKGGSAVGVPLVLENQVEGLLTVGSRQPRRFGAEELRVLQRLSSQTSVALGNARLHANVHALSLTDPLTGLPNRRRLQIHLDHEVAAARRGRHMAIAVFDIDKFKHYNDTFGHIAGDDILKAVAGVLADENRTMNIVARYGGDEFVSVLSETGLEGARHFVERIEARVAENEVLTKFGISISIGCAAFDPDTMASVNDVLRAADADMYDAKAKRHEELKANP